jgi:hypothetical protein
MLYSTGETIRIGDKVSIGNASDGLVVCDFDQRQHLDGYADWLLDFELSDGSRMSSGVLTLTEAFGLLYYAEPDEDIIFLARDSQ